MHRIRAPLQFLPALRGGEVSAHQYALGAFKQGATRATVRALGAAARMASAVVGCSGRRRCGDGRGRGRSRACSRAAAAVACALLASVGVASEVGAAAVAAADGGGGVRAGASSRAAAEGAAGGARWDARDAQAQRLLGGLRTRAVAAAGSDNEIELAAAARARGALAAVPRVVLAEGTWKYVQVELSVPGEAESVRVRIYACCEAPKGTRCCVRGLCVCVCTQCACACT